MRPVATYDANYVNSAGYWMAFHEAAGVMRHEVITADDADKAYRMDVWMILSVRYSLHSLGL